MRFLQSRIFVTILRYGHKLSINSIDQYFKKHSMNTEFFA
ncbi:hypothetical protein EMIT048CA2_80154 [Pseudomonas chlororaphis]